ncbi:leucine-rich repeat domain-containing protein [Runella slithyformis]|uniref:Leucine-rich repeat-containing protein typical subtype n=1 Tax=Runella slithyformis (strain ATCC 29530 / DSM 19594 / LMG 11500 / NCIMB 11436 / LSU 4) TaxID=761193 RepID=A0A7U3ZN93_RUNSL|nr:leucine-rich repeat domain-containing protein [Runella slithyformis]AEI50345.1 leucine-rich repeat-containing protein typical subtype [Runella slithyformis DSM 19594]
MKILSALPLLLILSSASAQVIIMPFAEAAKQGMTYKKLDSLYRGTRPFHSGTQEEYVKEENALLRRKTQIARKIFGIRTAPAAIMYHLYTNKTGRFDYLLYEIRGQISPESEKALVDSLRHLLNAYRFGVKITSAHVSSHFMNLGLIRSIPKGDSIISSLEAAQSTTRPDTVKVLALNQLELTQVPDVMYRFPNLKELNLSGNELKIAHIAVNRLPKLRQIWLNNNQLTDSSLHLTQNKTLQILNIQGNRFTDIPQAVKNCRRLKSLWMGYNNLTALNQKSFRKLRRLQDINLYSCGLKTLPKDIVKLRRLEVLDVYYNDLSTIPPSVSRMRRLQQLALSHNQLTLLPDNLGKLRHLQALYLHHNRLNRLPGSIGKLTSLQILDIGYNQFSTLPAQIGSLHRMEEMDMSYNNLSEVPPPLPYLRQLKKLYLRENPVAQDAQLREHSKAIVQILEAKNIQVSY